MILKRESQSNKYNSFVIISGSQLCTLKISI